MQAERRFEFLPPTLSSYDVLRNAQVLCQLRQLRQVA